MSSGMRVRAWQWGVIDLDEDGREPGPKCLALLTRQRKFHVLHRGDALSYITWTHEMTEFKVASIKDYDPDPMNGQTYKTEFWFDV